MTPKLDYFVTTAVAFWTLATGMLTLVSCPPAPAPGPGELGTVTSPVDPHQSQATQSVQQSQATQTPVVIIRHIVKPTATPAPPTEDALRYEQVREQVKDPLERLEQKVEIIEQTIEKMQKQEKKQ